MLRTWAWVNSYFYFSWHKHAVLLLFGGHRHKEIRECSSEFRDPRVRHHRATCFPAHFSFLPCKTRSSKAVGHQKNAMTMMSSLGGPAAGKGMILPLLLLIGTLSSSPASAFQHQQQLSKWHPSSRVGPSHRAIRYAAGGGRLHPSTMSTTRTSPFSRTTHQMANNNDDSDEDDSDDDDADLPTIDDYAIDAGNRIVGTICNHPTVPDGAKITTIPLLEPNLVEEGATVATESGSRYRLGRAFDEGAELVERFRREVSARSGSASSVGDGGGGAAAAAFVAKKDASQSTATTSTTPSTTTSDSSTTSDSAEPQSDDGDDDLPVLNEWRIDGKGQVVGTVTDHPVYSDGDVITTSKLRNSSPDDAVAADEGAVVTTESGSRYRLGTRTRVGAKQGSTKGVDDKGPPLFFVGEERKEEEENKNIPLFFARGPAGDAAEDSSSDAEKVDEGEGIAAEKAAAKASVEGVAAANSAVEQKQEGSSKPEAKPETTTKRFKTLRERMEFDQAERERLTRMEAGGTGTEGLVVEKAEAEQERIEAERLAAEKAEQERIEAERVAAEKAEQERIEAERVAAEKAEQERLEQERIEAERVAAEKAEQERLEQERIEAERVAAEEAEQERLEAERVEAERIAAAAEAARLEEEQRLAQERAEAARIAEEQRLAQELAEAARIAEEEERIAAEERRINEEKAAATEIAAEEPPARKRFKTLREQMDFEQAERQRLMRMEAEGINIDDAVAETAKTERAIEERIEAERVAAEKAEQERVEAKRIAAQEKAEQERIEAEKIKAERIAAEKAEQERLEAERIATETEAARLEKEQRLEQERAEAARIAEEEKRVAEEKAEAAAAEERRVKALAAESAKQEPLEKKRFKSLRERMDFEQAERQRIEKERIETEQQQKALEADVSLAIEEGKEWEKVDLAWKVGTRHFGGSECKRLDSLHARSFGHKFFLRLHLDDSKVEADLGVTRLIRDMAVRNVEVYLFCIDGEGRHTAHALELENQGEDVALRLSDGSTSFGRCPFVFTSDGGEDVEATRQMLLQEAESSGLKVYASFEVKRPSL